MSTGDASPVVLRTAVVWGTTVLAVRDLRRGESLALGDHPRAVFPKPEGLLIADWPIVAVGDGFQVDARGASGGMLRIQGRSEDPARLAQAGSPIAIGRGDHGLVQYGSFGVFFQVMPGVPKGLPFRRIEWSAILGFLFALVTVGGALSLVAAFAAQSALQKPIDLSTPGEVAARFRPHTALFPWMADAPPPAASAGTFHPVTLRIGEGDASDDLQRVLSTIPSGPEALGGLNPQRGSDARTQRSSDSKAEGLSPSPSQAEVDKIVDSKMDAFMACYAVGRSDNPRLAGDVVVTWNITAAGTVDGARIASTTMANPRVEACMLNQIQKLRFRAAREPRLASFSFTFPVGD